MKTLMISIVVSLFVLTGSLAQAQEAYVQIIHNSPDPAAGTVDIYVNGGDDPAIPGLAFRAATGMVALPAGVDLEVGIAAGGSMGPEDIIATWTFNLPADSKTIVMASGLLGVDFDLFTNAMDDPTGDVGILAFHGAPDAPGVDVGAVGVGVLIENLMYQTFQGYLTVPAADYTLTVAPTGGTPIAAFDAPLSGLAGANAVVFASGYLGMEPAFGLFAALADGTVIELAPDNTVSTDRMGFDGVKALYRN